MKVLIAVKRVVDYNVKVRVKADQSGVETANVKMSMNPFDEIAIEEAVRWREQNLAEELIAISIGPKPTQEVLRTALAMGADRAIHINTDQEFEPLNIAKILQQQITALQPDVVLLGKQAIDDDCNQTAQMLAGLLDWPQACFSSKIEMAADKLQVTREIDGGLETITVNKPAIISTDLRLNEPRYVALPNIMKAKRKPLETIELDSLALDLRSRSRTVKVTEPPVRKAGIKVADVSELLNKLRDEAKVIQ